MNTQRGWSGVVLVAALCATSLPGQWLLYPTPGVPKTPSGLPNLGAPTPRTADGKPDLSGMWEADNTRPCPPYGCPDQRLSAEFLDFGTGLKGGLPYQPWTRDLVKERILNNGKDDPASQCLPPGLPRMHAFPWYRKYFQLPGVIIILSERGVTFRQIFTDGRPLPVDPQPSFHGYSTGKWEGDTLVVESNGLRNGTWLDRNGNPLTDAARVTERFRRVNYGNMEIQVTVDDPKAYTAPWTIKISQFLVLNAELLDYICENERDTPHLVGK